MSNISNNLCRVSDFPTVSDPRRRNFNVKTFREVADFFDFVARGISLDRTANICDALLPPLGCIPLCRGLTVFDSSSVPSAIFGSAKQYRLKARNYRASASAERDWNRRQAFELLADTFDRLAADYERAESLRA
jgi:hypothetical protein